MSAALRDPREYLQRRVALFSGVSFIFFVAMLVADFATPAPGEPTFSSTRIASMVVLAASGAVWLYTRRGQRPAWASRALELAFMLVAMVVFNTLPLYPPIAGAGGAMAFFGPILMAVVLFLRAAIIPSRSWLSVLLGLIWGGTMAVCAAVGWEGITVIPIPGQPEYPAWMLPVAIDVTATIAFSFVAGVISHVVYGLQTSVREAMQLGQYTLESKIGEGGMGAVYRARHRMLRRPTAVKLLLPKVAGTTTIARFEREVQLTSELSHPNTITIFDYGRTPDGVFYYAMELLEGATLETMVDIEGALPQTRIVHLLRQIAGALSEAHDRGLIHRDIKPGNIILCERGGISDTVKVVDFGLVKAIKEDSNAQKVTQANIVAGTPLYMSPEMIAEPNSVDARTDIYSLGALAYFMITGTNVFDGGTMVEVCGHHLHSTPEPPSTRAEIEVDEGLERLVLDCLQKKPSDRPANMQQFLERLEEVNLADEWTKVEAHRWWSDNLELVTKVRARASGTTSGQTIAIDLRSRA